MSADDSINVIPSSKIETSVSSFVRHELHHLRSHWWWFMLLGILLLLCGTASIVDPMIASVAAVRVLAVILMVAGVVTIVGSFWAGKWSGFLVSVLVGMLYLAAALVVTDRPFVSIQLITVFIAVTFMVLGAFRLMAALSLRYPQWGWSLLNGMITFIAGLVIYRNLPASALWVIGLLIGLEMTFSGLTWIMLALAIRRLPKDS